jgi:anti-anti-sigma regulatory factor
VGEIDLFTAPKLREQFLSTLDEGGETGDLLVDLSLNEVFAIYASVDDALARS